MPTLSRKEALGAGALALGAATGALGAPETATVRVGVVGVGGRGSGLLGMMLQMPDVAVPALCDIDRPRLDAAQAMVAASGRPRPIGYSSGDEAYRQMMERDDLDAVVIATPWNWHTPMAVRAMERGIYAAVEVPCALSVAECWELVDTSEKTGVPCMMLENWSFRRDNLAVLQMIRKGLLGEMVHCHCAHSHDCIDHWFFDPQGVDRWPARFLVEHNRDQYPTHSLGPVLSWMDINCGDVFGNAGRLRRRPEVGLHHGPQPRLPPVGAVRALPDRVRPSLVALRRRLGGGARRHGPAGATPLPELRQDTNADAHRRLRLRYHERAGGPLRRVHRSEERPGEVARLHAGQVEATQAHLRRSLRTVACLEARPSGLGLRARVRRRSGARRGLLPLRVRMTAKA
ncbi:MAG: Gfo/Idh/MocA family oxidoreductase [Armatimonadetes bacterium]|nr:Gfo/Idh/MocA family oxidoreductase [Armatimonadota bacterium]